MDDVECPDYYVVPRSLTDEQIDLILHILTITPIACAIITDLKDAELGRKLGPEVIHANTVACAHELAAQIARETGSPSIIVGETRFFEARYADGRKENIEHEI